MLFFLGLIVGLLVPLVFCLAFIGYAEWTLRRTEVDSDDREPVRRS